MPIKIPSQLPAYNVLSNENIFVMNIERAIIKILDHLR